MNIQISKNEKIVISIVTIFLLCTITCFIINLVNESKKPKISVIKVLTTEEMTLTPYKRSLSEKYQAYEMLYNSKEPLFVYGYNTFGENRIRDKYFHQEMQKKFKKANLNYKYLAVENWKNISAKIIDKYEQKNYQSDNNCSPEIKMKKELKDFLEISESCMKNACIIDNNKHKIIYISRDVDYIIKTLKNYPKIQNNN